MLVIPVLREWRQVGLWGSVANWSARLAELSSLNLMERL